MINLYSSTHEVSCLDLLLNCQINDRLFLSQHFEFSTQLNSRTINSVTSLHLVNKKAMG